MAQVQYNFKIEEEIKQKAEVLSQEFESKQDFLNTMIRTYESYRQNNQDTDIDVSRYDELESNTKSILSEAFKHIIYTIQSSNSNYKHLASSIEKDKLAIEEERKNFEHSMRDLQLKHSQEIKAIEDTKKEDIAKKEDELNVLKSNIEQAIKEVQIKTKEVEDLKAIAEYTKEIKSDLKSSKEQLEFLSKELKVKEEKISNSEKDTYRKDIQIEQLKKEVEKMNSENEKLKILEKENIQLQTKLEIYNGVKNV